MRIVVIGNLAPSLILFRGTLLAKLASMGHEVFACAPGVHSDVASELKSMGVTYIPVNFDRTGINPFKDFISFFRFLFLFWSTKPDIVLNYTIKPIVYGSIAARMISKATVFSVITGLGYVFIGKSFKQKLLRSFVSKLYGFGLSGNEAIFFLNPDDLKLFKELKLVGNLQKTVLLNGEGVDLEQYGQVPPQAGKQVFLLIARLLYDKGIGEFVSAAQLLKEKYPAAVFRLLGPYDNNPAAINQTEVNSWLEQGIIEYLGECNDVRPHIADCTVYVLPSYREGTPRTVLEAMAMGRPIVTTDVPGCRETVLDGENGFMVPARDVKTLAAAMEKFILRPGLTVSMGKRSRELAVEKYDVHKVNNVFLKAMGLCSETDS